MLQQQLISWTNNEITIFEVNLKPVNGLGFQYCVVEFIDLVFPVDNMGITELILLMVLKLVYSRAFRSTP